MAARRYQPTVSGRVFQIQQVSIDLPQYGDPKGYYRYFVVAAQGGLIDILRFRQEWKDHLELLIKGQRVSVVGKIDGIAHDGITLGECEIIGHSPVPFNAVTAAHAIEAPSQTSINPWMGPRAIRETTLRHRLTMLRTLPPRDLQWACRPESSD